MRGGAKLNFFIDQGLFVIPIVFTVSVNFIPCLLFFYDCPELQVLNEHPQRVKTDYQEGFNKIGPGVFVRRSC